MKDGFLMMELMRAFYWFDEGLQSALRRRGWPSLSRSQSITLANIALDIRRPADIARNLGISRQAVSILLQDMVRQGLICVEPDPTDRRASIVRFSEQSSRLRADALDILAGLEAAVAARVGPAALRTMREALGRDWGPADAANGG